MFCLLPTAAICGWSVSRKLPGHVRECERQLTSQLGLTAKLAAVSYPQPGTRLYEGLELSDPETGQPIFHCRFLRVSRVEDRLAVHASTPALEAGRLGQVWELLVRRLRHELAGREKIELLPCQLTLRNELGEQTYELLGGRIEPEAGGEAAELRFRLPGAEMPEPAGIRIVRHQPGPTPSTKFVLSTGGAALPCSLFAPLGEAAEAFGTRATFAGNLWADDAADGWQAELTGRFEQIDLDSLVSSRFNHILQGNAALELSGARFDRSQLVEAHGRLTAGPGAISGTIVQAAIEALGCHSPLKLSPDEARGIRGYQELAMAFSLDADGLRVAGICRGQPPGVMLVGEEGAALLAKSGARPLPAIALLRLLVPASEEMVPATGATRRLIPWLPAPPTVPRADRDGSRPAPAASIRAARSRG
ncbi:MAG TPA: hypothetical protein VGN42_25490 [Pirellulales bacterium]|nr:hypothetical protein [Pirellulales bacterium]